MNKIVIKPFLMSVTFVTLISCFGGKQEEFLFDLPDYFPTLNETVGKYYFVPKKDDYLDDYKYLKLKKGDTLFLEINKDSTFIFNRFYFNDAKFQKKILGKLEINDSKIIINPEKSVPECKIFLSGFKKSKKTNDLYYYYGINQPNDNTDFEYYLIYKKIK